MQREKKDRNKLIIKKIKKKEYQVDIAKEFGISPAMVSKIKKRLMKNESKKGRAKDKLSTKN